MKFIFLIYSLFILTCKGLDFESKWSGNTDYTNSKSQSMITTIQSDYQIIIHEFKNKKYAITLNGKVNTAHDHFGNEINLDVFTTIGIDF